MSSLCTSCECNVPSARSVLKFVELQPLLLSHSLYKARLFSTARALLAETTLDPSSSSSVGESHLANGALPSPGSVHSSPRELLVMGESPRPTEDDPTGAVAAAKRKRSNGSESDRGDDKDDSKNGQQLPSPVSGTDTEAGKDGDKKDETKDEAGGAEAKDKGSVGGGGTRGRDYAKARKEAVDRPELRRPDVDGGERSERGLLHEVRILLFFFLCLSGLDRFARISGKAGRRADILI